MANSTQEARARRTAARDRRRGRVSEPPEEIDEKTQDTAQQATSRANGHIAGAAAKVVGTAVAAALLGVVGGAAKGLLERRADDAEAEDDRAENDPSFPEPIEDPESRGHGGEEAEEDREQADDQPQAHEREDEPETARSVDEGVSGDVAAEIAAQARRHLETLLGTEVERVSGLERVDGGWSVTLEVVELARIPESTDVLATYELVLDEDRQLMSANRGHRYRRSQIDEAS